jgi:PAS domain S-box-containing protein
VTKSQAISLDSIIANAPQFIFWKGINSIYLGCNTNFAYIAGLNNATEIQGKSDLDLPWGKFSADIYLEEDRYILTTGKPLEQKEVPLLTAQNETIIVLVSKKPIFNHDGQVIGILGIYIDITERKKYEAMLKEAKERAESVDRAKSEFIANMSHDVRTPLAGVIGMAKILENNGDSLEDREYGQVIHTSSERLLILLNDILEVVSAEATNKDILQYETFSLQTRIKHLRDLMLPSFHTKQLQLNTFIDPKLPEYIVSDRIKIDRILLNIVSNALKFTHTGEISVHLRLLSQTKDHANLEISVSDTGIGISEDQIDKIFDRFYRIYPSFSNTYRGHGIGLYIVQKYVALLQGTISVTSELGQGTTFSVILPVKFVSETKAEANPPIEKTYTNLESIDQYIAPAVKISNNTQHEEQSEHSCLKILLIEDDIIAKRIAKNFLQTAGFEVIDVENAEQGIKSAISQPYDLIITDIGLPGMDGYQFTALTRYWEKITHRQPMPIIGLTAHGTNQENEAKTAGMDKLIPKPISDIKVNELLKQFFPEYLTRYETSEASIFNERNSKLRT